MPVTVLCCCVTEVVTVASPAFGNLFPEAEYTSALARGEGEADVINATVNSANKIKALSAGYNNLFLQSVKSLLNFL
jgi:hypothetical protein